MPTITPSYLYTIVAILAVTTLLTVSFTTYTEAFRSTSEIGQLKNLMNYVAAKTTELSTLSINTNATAETFLQMPTTIGNKAYWLQLRNDTTKTWIEGGFGNTPTNTSEIRVYLPSEAKATGHYKSGYGAAHIKCYVDSQTLQILLESTAESE